MNRVVASIWGGMLIATGLGVVPIVVVLLKRTLKAARSIEQYTAETLASGVGAATNTANVAALKETISIAPQLVAGAESLAGHIASIQVALAAKASDTSPVEGERGEL